MKAEVRRTNAPKKSKQVALAVEFPYSWALFRQYTTSLCLLNH